MAPSMSLPSSSFPPQSRPTPELYLLLGRSAPPSFLASLRKALPSFSFLEQLQLAS
uniref:Uncharacterized protein n=1 Tax=Picea glauca TaxID=3330 RepID=A0A117NI91_PICGL|nr:hypothetical protein ABT39_MTgene2805 [Picea glauca]QHR87663.1 hypothetical protein Q903MT_gene1675 [Picea sitchensis]